jgi:hypothetical protein
MWMMVTVFFCVDMLCRLIGRYQHIAEKYWLYFHSWSPGNYQWVYTSSNCRTTTSSFSMLSLSPFMTVNKMHRLHKANTTLSYNAVRNNNIMRQTHKNRIFFKAWIQSFCNFNTALWFYCSLQTTHTFLTRTAQSCWRE